MNIIDIDIPLLVSCFLVAVWAKIFRSQQFFQLLCQFLATFTAQYSLVVSWSLARLIPIFAATDISRSRSEGLSEYLPFVLYSIFASLIFSQFWYIPSSVKFWYGDGRVFVQVFNFSVLVAVTVTLTSALLEKGGLKLLLFFLQLAAIVHGFASFYQVVAGNFGLPLIGISRSHGENANEFGDVAAFISSRGNEILRPGGLMGEPKSAAVLFGIVLMHHIFFRIEYKLTTKQRLFHQLSLALSLFGFISAFSTSGFIGFAVAFFVIVFSTASSAERLKIILRVLSFSVLLALGWSYLNGANEDGLFDILADRSLGRFTEGQALDIPVEASLDKLMTSPLIAIFGVGMGGSSFVVMEYIGESFDYAFAPNIIFVLFLIESGLIGTLFFLGVFTRHFARVRQSLLFKFDSEIKALFVVAVSAMIIGLSGSGIALGMPLAVACMAVAAYKVRMHQHTFSIDRGQHVRPNL